MTPAELKNRVESRGTGSLFFCRQNMRHAGDRMGNFGVRSKPVELVDSRGATRKCWELYRRRPVKGGVTGSFYFDCETFERVFPAEGGGV